jgi:glycosyltransferase involved in cell wall biosynthesis
MDPAAQRDVGMPRVVHLAKFYPPHVGGMETVVASFARAAAKAGWAVEVVCFDSASAVGDVCDTGVRICRTRFRLRPASQPLSARYLWVALSRARNADLVHLHAPNFLAVLAAMLLPRDRPLIVHWHSDVIGKGWLARALAPAERWLLRRASAVVATSDPYARASAALGGCPASKLRIVPIGVPDPATSAIAVPPLPAPLVQWLRGRKIVLGVGRLVAYKGFGVLVRAAGELHSDAATVIVGDGPEAANLERLIHDERLGDRVWLYGAASADELHALLGAATVFCLPSLQRAEAFGVVIVEAMARGIPVVATKIAGSGVSWVNGDSVSGFNVPVGDAHALAQACNLVIESTSLRHRLGAGARQRFLDQFEEGRATEAILALYREFGTHRQQTKS